MIVDVILMKFGGTSVGGAAAIRRACDVVAARARRRPVVVVSAMAGVTDALLDAARMRAGATEAVDAVVDRHRAVLAELALAADLLDDLFAALRARVLSVTDERAGQRADAVASFGERLSARVFAAALCAVDVPASPVDAFEAGLRTDSSFGRARPAPDDESLRLHLAGVRGVPVVTGFIGADEDGNITTLGRDGSDFTAALVGAAVGVEEVQIWTAVDGVHTADPRLVPPARPIRAISYSDLADLASFGSGLLHPAAVLPLQRADIPLRLRNTFAAEAAGTTVQVALGDEQPAVRVIAHRDRVVLITLRPQRLVTQRAFLSSVFRELEASGGQVRPVAVGGAEVTVAADEGSADAAAEHLARHGQVDVCPGRAIIGLIGDAALAEFAGVAEVLAVLARGGVAGRRIGYGAFGTTVALSVASDQLRAALSILHSHLLSQT